MGNPKNNKPAQTPERLGGQKPNEGAMSTTQSVKGGAGSAKPSRSAAKREQAQMPERMGSNIPQMPMVTADPNFPDETPEQKAARTKKVSKSEVEAIARTDEAKTRKALESEPKVRFLIPLFPGEKPGAIQDVRINGVVFSYKKGVMYDIPSTVADLLASKYTITLNAGRELELGNADEATRAALDA